jgi:hypothetical protein
MTRTSVKAVLAGLAMVVTTVAGSALPAAAVGPEGAATLTTVSGSGTTAFGIQLPSGASCSGGGGAGYRWATFIASASVDASTLTFSDGPNPVSGAFVSGLTNTVGDPNITGFPSSSPTGLISGIPQFDLSSLIGSIPVGAYNIGIFCYNVNGANAGALEGGHFWQRTISITSSTQSSLNFVVGVVVPPAEIPEVPLSVLLPLSAAALGGGVLAVQRRRRSASSVA